MTPLPRSSFCVTIEGRGGNCRPLRHTFYAELELFKDRHILALFISTVSEGKVTWRDAMDMTAEELIQTFSFYNTYNKAVENKQNLNLTKLKQAMQR